MSPNTSVVPDVWTGTNDEGDVVRDLVERAQRGDRAAFDELARLVAPDLFRLAVVVIGHEGATDALQDALLRFWRDLPSLRDCDAFPAWSRRILVNRCRDIVRARRGVHVLSLDFAGDGDGAGLGMMAADPAPEAVRSADLRAAIAGLTFDQRLVIALHYGLDLPIRDVARTLGVPDGTAKSRMNAALVALRRALQEPSHV
jgi:RNA polymerase sigma-70 factor (ECF subfamily)